VYRLGVPNTVNGVGGQSSGDVRGKSLPGKTEKTEIGPMAGVLSAVVIDEVHAFAADDRGAHLASLMERLVSMCGRDLQRIGLSATVGNPHVIGEWLQGSSRRPFRLVDPPRPKVERGLV
jgi:ATP-dependent Lhr-like helicase